MKKIISTISTDSKGVHTMKKTLMVLALATVLVFSFATVASAQYASYSAGSAYLSWGGANAIAGTDQVTPHGGYTETTVKCAVCHSTHRAYSANTAAGVGADINLLAGANSCAACHAAWGSNSAGNTLVEYGQDVANTGPHFKGTGTTCYNEECHGSVHNSGTQSKYAAVRKYNLTSNGSVAALDAAIDTAIGTGNTGADIGTDKTGRAMKAYVTGYTCVACHTQSSFAIAAVGYTNSVSGVKNMMATGTDTTSASSFRTGHPSIGNDTWGTYVPTCETCHDLVGVATKTTAFPHANRGIDVFKGRYDEEAIFGGNNGTAGDASIVNNESGQIATDNTDTTRYGLWMTSGLAVDDGSAHGERAGADATPIQGGNSSFGYSLRDGACLKCHVATKLP